MEKILADEYLKGLASAYVWVASADKGVDLIEFHKYEAALVQSQFATQFDNTDIRHYFKDMVALFIDNYDSAVQLTKDRLKKISKKEFLTEEVIRICRAAVVADGKVAESEELVLQEIANLLQLNITS
jgi:tellurite resistance protein